MLRSRFPIHLKPIPLLYSRRSIATTASQSTKMGPGHRERGLKAAINNPRVSEQAKQRDREILESEFGTHMPEESTTADIAEEEVLTDIPSSKLGSSSTSSTSKKGRSKSAGSHEASAGIQQSSTSADLEGKDRGNV